jgi:Tol biopolymer transport system component
LAPILSAVGLAVVAVLTLGLFTGRLPFVTSSGPGGGGGVSAGQTPAPSNVVVVDPRTKVPGSIVYVKAGNIWIQSGTDAKQLTDTGHDSMPTWSMDGQWIYFVETRTERGLYPFAGPPVFYDLTYPIVTRVKPDGSGRQQIASGKFTTKNGKYQWFYWLRQPVPDETGKTLAVASDATDPTRTDVVIQLMDIATGKLTDLGLPENAPLGQQDPAWRPAGRDQLLYVMNGRDGPRGAPAIWRWDPQTKKARALTGPGYLAPAWSPDGLYIAATKTSSLGTDIVVLDFKTGSEVLRVTDDGRSWGPIWSPAGDAIAFLHMDGGIVDLRMVKLTGNGPGWKVGEPLDLTQYSGLDGGSRPSWYIPPDQMPPPTAAPATPSSSAASPSPS